MYTQAILQCLPLLADILGRTYGVTVQIGGKDAFTIGRTIRLPHLPAQADPTFIHLVRGYIDHESAHVRDTNFAAIQQENPTPLEHYVWNVLEDWRVEQKLAASFPGCRQNFQWLIRHLFTPSGKQIFGPVDHLLNWLLLTVRSWDVAELVPHCTASGQHIDLHWPGLRDKLTVILNRMRAYCPDSLVCLDYARQIVACLADQAASGKATDDLNSLLQSSARELPQDLGQILRAAMGAQNADASNWHGVATEGQKPMHPLTLSEMELIQKITAGMQAQLSGKLQASRLVQHRPSRHGKLDPQRLYRIALGEQRVFLSHETKPAINTAVHIPPPCAPVSSWPVWPAMPWHNA